MKLISSKCRYYSDVSLNALNALWIVVRVSFSVNVSFSITIY